jgi:hypothetical protein
VSPEDGLDFLIICEKQHSKENLFLFVGGMRDASLLNEGVGHLLELIVDDYAVLAVLGNVIHHHDIVRSWVLHDQLHVVFMIKLNYVIGGLLFQLLHLGQFELTKFLKLLRSLFDLLICLLLFLGINHDQDGPQKDYKLHLL